MLTAPMRVTSPRLIIADGAKNMSLKLPDKLHICDVGKPWQIEFMVLGGCQLT